MINVHFTEDTLYQQYPGSISSDNDDNVYTYKLLDDYSNGDLEIKVL